MASKDYMLLVNSLAYNKGKAYNATLNFAIRFAHFIAFHIIKCY